MSNYKRPIKTSKNWVKKTPIKNRTPPTPRVLWLHVAPWKNDGIDFDLQNKNILQVIPSYRPLPRLRSHDPNWSMKPPRKPSLWSCVLFWTPPKAGGWQLGSCQVVLGAWFFLTVWGWLEKLKLFFFAQKVIIKCKQRESWKLRMGMMRVMEISSKKLRVLPGYTCWNVHCWCFNTQKEVPDSNRHLGNPGV